jgi:transcriptional regulator with XRE-family HTH domain
MDNGHELHDFLVSRRAKVTPEQAGLPAYGGNRRVAGLRREEVAMLAGVSIDYYVRLERGRATGASESVLEGIARALQLDEAERAHLFDLARAAAPAAPRAPRRTAAQQVRPSVRRILDSMTTTPAYVRNARLDMLAANPLGAAFRTWWAAHNVRFHRTGVKRFHHPVVGDLTLTFESLALAADAGLRISAYGAEPGTPSDDALKLLATWAATLDQAGQGPGRLA